MALTRRTFVMGAAAASTLIGRNWAQSSKPQHDLRVAVIGLRGRGRDHIRGVGDHLTAICDVDEDVLGQTAEHIEKDQGRKVQTYTDFRKLLDDADIDAVTIATPNHTHCLIGILACAAGKDVYCEKPISHNVWEGRQLVNAARKYDRIVQCGTQSRSMAAIQEVVPLIQGGLLGPIQHITGTCYKPRRSIGKLDKPLSIPSSIDYDLWCGPADKVDLHRPQLHYDWHWDFNTGSGDMGNQGVHQIDVARWFLGEDRLPSRVLSIGGRVGYDDAGDTPNTQIVLFDYETAPLIFETRGLPHSKQQQSAWAESMDSYRGSQVGVVVQCQDGYVVLPYYQDVVAYNNDGNQINTWKGLGNHYANWLQAVAARDRTMLNADIAEGHLSSALCHIGNISHRVGQPAAIKEIDQAAAINDSFADSLQRMKRHLELNEVDITDPTLILGEPLSIDEDHERISDNPHANELLRRDGRNGFSIPDLSEKRAVLTD